MSAEAWRRFLEEQVEFWLGFMEKWVVNVSDENRSKCFYVPYQALTEDTPSIVNDLLAFLGEAGDYSDLEFRPTRRRLVEQFLFYDKKDIEKTEERCGALMQSLSIPSILLGSGASGGISSDVSAEVRALMKELEFMSRRAERLTNKIASRNKEIAEMKAQLAAKEELLNKLRSAE
jgi:hypothetical protein